MKISLAHSPDADDAFMFYAISQGKIDLSGYEFEHVLCDIQTLNKLAIESQKYDITAVSYNAFPLISENYELMNSGSSMGDNYGPVLICSEQASIKELEEKIKLGEITVAIPGKLTSAYMALKLWSHKVTCAEEPFDKIEELVKNGKYQAGLIIHEGQLTFQEDKFKKIVDLGEWWFERTNGLPLPLGANAIRKNFSPQVKADLERILSASIEYGIKNKDEAVDYAIKFGRGLGREKAKEFVGMYVNELTLDLGKRGKESVQKFYSEAKKIILAGKKAVLFDLDGTLVNTDPFHFMGWQNLLAEHNIKISKEFYQEHISGRHNTEIAKDLFAHLPSNEAEKQSEDKEERFRQVAKGQLEPITGLKEFIKYLRDEGLKIGLVTNAPKKNVEFSLGALDLENSFDAMVMAEDVYEPKPAPAPYIECLRKLCIEAKDAIAIEDSPSGIRSATGAGLFTVGITTSQSQSSLVMAGASMTIKDYLDFQVNGKFTRSKCEEKCSKKASCSL